jgi:hypothetical protein
MYRLRNQGDQVMFLCPIKHYRRYVLFLQIVRYSR